MLLPFLKTYFDMRKASLILLCLTFLSLSAKDVVSLKVEGDPNKGYNVNLYYGNTLVSTQDDAGEMSLYLENEDYSAREYIRNWKATSYSQADNKIVLSGIVDMKNLESFLRISVIYEVVNDNVVSKQIELFQNNAPFLYYSLTSSLVPMTNPSRFWSFDDINNKGGIVHETYPAAGYFVDDKVAVGILTDAGDKNLWTRNIRRRPSKQGEIGFRALKEICDAGLYCIDTETKRVNLTLGEVADFNNSTSQISIPAPDAEKWKSYHDARLIKTNDGVMIKSDNARNDISGFRIPYNLSDGFYTIRFKHKSDKPLTVKLWKGEGTDPIDVAGLHYQTDMRTSASEWIEQEETVFIANTEGEHTYLLIAASSLKKGERFNLEVKDLEVIQSIGKKQAYHRLEQGKTAQKKIFIFAEELKPTIHDVRLASQVHLANGLGFKGSIEEKCLYACYQMLMWITSRHNFNPLNVPSINYAPDMYNRDSFWSLVGVYDKVASENIFNQWASTQTDKGAIGTIITPAMGSKEAKDNEATLEFLWYALINNKRYGTPIPKDKVKKAFEYCINEFDPDRDGICRAEFALGQNDVVYYPGKTSDLSVNQGMFAISLKVAQDLGMPVTDEYIEKAKQEYRNFYDNEQGYLIDNKSYKYVISFNSLLPEFVSWWLYNEPILTSEMVINTLDKMVVRQDCSPIISHVDDVFFTMENKPFMPDMYWANGQYYNGGSWMREEICGYVAGMKHGWKPAEKRIRERLAAEINTHPDEPFSHEFIPLDLNQPGCWWPSLRVFSWNVFVLQALEVAGMRSPEQDPMYSVYEKLPER